MVGWFTSRQAVGTNRSEKGRAKNITVTYMRKAIVMYNDTRVQHVLGMGTRTHDFNCWGATKFIADPKTPTLAWVEYDEMGEWLRANYRPIKRTEVREGDIVALFDKGDDYIRLIHTAYCVGNSKYVHKVGSNVARLESLKAVLKTYADSANAFVFFRRKEVLSCE